MDGWFEKSLFLVLKFLHFWSHMCGWIEDNRSNWWYHRFDVSTTVGEGFIPSAMMILTVKESEIIPNHGETHFDTQGNPSKYSKVLSFFPVTFVKKKFLPWQDVDAIFRLTRPLPCNFAGLEQGHPSAMAIPPQFLTGFGRRGVAGSSLRDRSGWRSYENHLKYTVVIRNS